MDNHVSINLSGQKFDLTKEMFKNFGQKPTEGLDVNLSLIVDSSAEYATNAREYYTRAMIGSQQTASRFDLIPNVKDRVKLGGAIFSDIVFRAGAVSPTFDDSEVLQKEFVVSPLMWATKIEIERLEIAFMSDQLRAGSNNFSDQFAFMTFFYQSLERHIAYLNERFTFLGGGGAQGLNAKMAADANVLKPTAGNGGIASAVTSANVIAKLTQARDVVATTRDGAVLDQPDFVYIVSRNVYNALMDTVSENKASGLYYIEREKLMFQGTEVYLAQGAPANTIIATYWKNLVHVCDLTDDSLGYNVVNFMNTTLERSIGIRADFKVNVDFINADEVYFHAFT